MNTTRKTRRVAALIAAASAGAILLALTGCGSSAPAATSAPPVATAPAAVPNPVTILKKIPGVVIPKGEVNGTYGIIGTDTRLAEGSVGNGSLAVYTGSSTADVVQAVALPPYPQDGEYIITGPDFLIEYQFNPNADGSYPQPVPSPQAIAAETGGTVTR
jgi:hypothetical protein